MTAAARLLPHAMASATLPHSAPTLPNGTLLVGKGHGGKHAGGPSRPTVQPIQALADAAVASGSAPPGGRAAYGGGIMTD